MSGEPNKDKKSKLARMRAKAILWRKKAEQSQCKADSMRQKAIDFRDRAKTALQTNKKLTDENSYLSSLLEQAEAECQTWQSRVERLERELAASDADNCVMVDLVEDLESIVADLEEQLNSTPEQEAESFIQLRRQLESAQEQVADLSAQLGATLLQLEQSESRNQRVAELETANRRITHLEARGERVSELEAQLESQLDRGAAQ